MSMTINFRILELVISFCTEVHLKTTILMFWTKFTQKGNLRSNKEYVNIIIELTILKLVKTKLDLIQTMFSFWTRLAQKG